MKIIHVLLVLSTFERNTECTTNIIHDQVFSFTFVNFKMEGITQSFSPKYHIQNVYVASCFRKNWRKRIRFPMLFFTCSNIQAKSSKKLHSYYTVYFFFFNFHLQNDCNCCVVNKLCLSYGTMCCNDVDIGTQKWVDMTRNYTK